jgi:(p)ppGpp synthase/HD superfamily hydrolase
MNQTAFNDALQFALQAHASDVRKETQIPYITHPVIVAETLAYYYPNNDALVLAGLLHDTVEDTDTPITVIREKFGERVATLVAAVTKPLERDDLPEDKIERWKVQRLEMLAHLGGDNDVLRLKAADALANLKAVARDLTHPEVGEGVWSRFKVGRQESLWYYQEILSKVNAGIANEPLTRELEGVLSQL